MDSSADKITAEYRGYRLTQMSGMGDCWYVEDGALHIEPGPIEDVKRAINQRECDMQEASGFDVWDIGHDSPKQWHKRRAVFRRRKAGHGAPSAVLTRNFAMNPDSFASVELADAAPDTAESRAAIDAAKIAHAEAVVANRRFREAVKAIPRLSEHDVAHLSERD